MLHKARNRDRDRPNVLTRHRWSYVCGAKRTRGSTGLAWEINRDEPERVGIGPDVRDDAAVWPATATIAWRV